MHTTLAVPRCESPNYSLPPLAGRTENESGVGSDGNASSRSVHSLVSPGLLTATTDDDSDPPDCSRVVDNPATRFKCIWTPSTSPRIPFAPAPSFAVHSTHDGTARLAACKAEEEPGLAGGEDGVRLLPPPRHIRKQRRVLTASFLTGRRDSFDCTERDPCRSQPSRQKLSSISSTSPLSSVRLRHAPSPSSAPRPATESVQHSTRRRPSVRRPRSMPSFAR